MHTNIVRFLQISTRNIASHRTVGSKSDSLDVFQHVSSRLVDSRRYVFSLRERAILLFSLSPSSPRSDGCYSTRRPRSATFPRRKARRGPRRGRVDRVIAGAGWHRLMGFEDSGARSHGPSPKNYEPASSASFRGREADLPSVPGLSRWPMIWNRGRKGKKVTAKASPPHFCFLLHAIIISFSCFSIVLHE